MESIRIFMSKYLILSIFHHVSKCSATHVANQPPHQPFITKPLRSYVYSIHSVNNHSNNIITHIEVNDLPTKPTNQPTARVQHLICSELFWPFWLALQATSRFSCFKTVIPSLFHIHKHNEWYCIDIDMKTMVPFTGILESWVLLTTDLIVWDGGWCNNICYEFCVLFSWVYLREVVNRVT